MTDLFADLNKYMWDIPMPRMRPEQLQTHWAEGLVAALCGLFTGENAIRSADTTKDNTDINSMVYYQLNTLKYKLSVKNTTDVLERAHNDYLVRIINKAFNQVFDPQVVKTKE